MARPTRTRKDEQKDIKEVAKQVAREAILEMNTQEDDGPDDETLSFIDSTTNITEEKRAGDPTGFDIFSDVGEPRTEQGDIIRYVIRKWGQHIATKFHPYSWEDMHEEFGSGNYQVIARSDNTKKFVKSESRILGDPRNASKKPQDENKAENIAPPQNQGLGFMELFTLLQEQQKQAKEEAREMTRDSQGTQNQMMMLVAELMKANSSSGSSSSVQMMQMITGMIQQQQNTTTQIFEKLAESQARMFEKINERIEKVSEKKTNEFDMFNKGIEMFSKMNELAEKRAQYQLELMEEAKQEARGDSDDDKPKKKSITDSLIEGILPVVSQALVSQQQNPALAQAQQQQLVALQRQAIQRRQLQIAQARRNQVKRNLQPRPGNTETKVEARSETITSSVNGEVQTNVENGGRDAGQDVVKLNGLPSIKIGETTPTVTPEVVDFSGEDTETLKTSGTLTVKEKCRALLPEFLGRQMLDNVPPNAAAPLLIEHLKIQGIGRDEFLAEVSANDLLDVGREYGLPEAAFEWLNELYAYIQSKPRNATRRKTSPSQQPTA